jgi:hypothetical protein
MVKLAGAPPAATFHLYEATCETFPAQSTATTANWCSPLFVVCTEYVSGDEHGWYGPFSFEHR